MLYEAQNRAEVVDQFGADFVRGFTIRNFCQTHDGQETPARLLVDDLDNPRLLIAAIGAMIHVEGAIDQLNGAFEDLLAGRVESEEPWPWASVEEDWVRQDEDGQAAGRKPYLFFNASSYASWRAARIAGFEAPEHDREGPDSHHGFVAYTWYWLGEPRFASEVRHPCRVVRSQELFELMKQAVPYDPEGYYIKQCLDHGPSFVCEIPMERGLQPASAVGAELAPPNGQGRASSAPTGEVKPVCWSCTHLTRFMGMIFTPEEQRRQGYARSLAALQIDTMLAEDGGIACCHVIDYNTPSMKMALSLGGACLPEPVVWRTVYWPGDAPATSNQ
jgi:hypothetical protein